MSTSCAICTRDLQDGYACHPCTAKLVEDLVFLAWYCTELAVTKNRQARLAGSGGKTNGSPLGFHIGAAMAYDAVHNALGGWVRILQTRDPWPADTPASVALWLAHRGDRMRNHPAVEALALDVERHTKTALQIINPLADEQTYGICGTELLNGDSCVAHLYGEPTADWVRCKACGNQHNTRERIAALGRKMEVLYFRAATLARLLPRLIERPVSANNIRCWTREGQPIRVRTGEDGYPEYHCGDVRDVALRVAKRDRPSKMTKEAS